MFTIPFIEIELTTACNLSCRGCTNYSDYNKQANWTPWDTAEKWFIDWSQRVKFDFISLMGGEPTLNPELDKWITGIRKIFPTTPFHIVTNGLLLHKKPWILDLLVDAGNCGISVSAHTPGNVDFIKSTFLLKKYLEPGTESSKRIWGGVGSQGLIWFKTFKGSYQNMKPHNNDPAEAFSYCCQQRCPLLYNGRLYKCSSIAKLKDTLTDWNKLVDKDWEFYLKYNGIDVTCSDDELSYWVQNFGLPESICSMCPTQQDVSSQILHTAVIK